MRNNHYPSSGVSRRSFLGQVAGTAAAVAALPAFSLGAEDNLWKLWARYVTGGAPYRPSFAAMFLDPMFLQIEVGPSDLPYAMSLVPGAGGAGGGRGAATPPPGGWGTASGLPPTGNAPAIIAENPPDLPWIPSSSAQTGIRTLMPRNSPVFNVLILNDQADWPQAARENIQSAVDDGKGFVVIHHALGDNQDWPWWYQEVTGGHLALRAHDGIQQSSMTPNTTLEVRPVGTHPIVQDIGPLRLTGETAYKGMWQSPKITPLLEATGTGSDRVVAWIGPNQKARVVCIQPGAASETHRNPAFRKLVRNAILWTGGRLA
ncbi:MAG: ThuA domain-containing protein [Candidatus Korobacteraceae bacterium]